MRKVRTATLAVLIGMVSTSCAVTTVQEVDSIETKKEEKEQTTSNPNYGINPDIGMFRLIF